ncbi:MAG: hypothetical protein EOO73_13970 [Myxococcales bacterium]|nr:MAG: hypothetical protein EOO73_13970 [Myxococcales bacterium]
MASRAQVFPNYSYGREVPRERRPVVFQTHDPVVLPRSRSWDINGGLIAAAAAATLLVAGATYAISYTEPARLGPTAAPALEREYVPDSDWARLNALKALSATPAPAALSAPADMMSVPPTATEAARSSFDSSAGLVPRTSSEVMIDDSAPGVQDSLPQPAQLEPSTAPYPNPTTTPPDAIAPPSEAAPTPGMDSASPALDNENPYR